MAFPHDGVKFQPGESGNPSGKPKGAKHLSTIIQELAEDIDWDKTQLKNKEELQRKYGRHGFKALTYVAFSKAMSGDTKAMEWLAKHGYGTKIRLEAENPIRVLLEKYGVMEGNSDTKTDEAVSGSPESPA